MKTPVLLLLLLLAPALAGRADAQILNTVQGWPADSTGWRGSLGGNASLTGGNSRESRVAGSARLQWVFGAERLRFMLAASRKDASGLKVSEEIVGHLRHNHRISDRWATVLFLQTQRNPFQRLKNRFLAGAGMEVSLLRGGSADLRAGATGMFEAEDIRDERDARETARLSAYLSGSAPIGGGTSVEGTVFYQPRFSAFADYRGYAVAEIVTELSSHVALTWGVEATWDARPPEGVREEDWELTGGFRVKL